MNNKIRLNLYKDLVKIRKVEETISELYKEQEMRCPIHLSIGQEAIAVGVCSNLNKTDQILSGHRAHAHYLAKGGSLNGMVGELYGKSTGCAKGKSGSMHLIDVDQGMMGSVPIVGSAIPIAVGLAWANKLNKKNHKVVVFFGEGATEEGAFHESLDFASLHNLPILFACENNQFSVYSHISKRQSREREITNISKAHGINSLRINGNDIEKVYQESKKIFNYIGKSNKPFLLEMDTYRYLEHCGPNNDDNLNYRSEKDIKYWNKKCPITNYKKYLLKNNFFSLKEIINIEKKVISLVQKSFHHAKTAPFPKISEARKHIYA